MTSWSYSRSVCVGAVVLISCGTAGRGETEDQAHKECIGPTASIEIGRLASGNFTPFEASEVVSVVHGVQGGTWIMPAVRLTDAEDGGDMDARLTFEDGTLLGEIHRARLRFATAADGSQVLQFLAVPVSDDPDTPALAVVDGASADLQLSYTATCGTNLTESFSVTLHVVMP